MPLQEIRSAALRLALSRERLKLDSPAAAFAGDLAILASGAVLLPLLLWLGYLLVVANHHLSSDVHPAVALTCVLVGISSSIAVARSLLPVFMLEDISGSRTLRLAGLALCSSSLAVLLASVPPVSI